MAPNRLKGSFGHAETDQLLDQRVAGRRAAAAAKIHNLILQHGCLLASRENSRSDARRGSVVCRLTATR